MNWLKKKFKQFSDRLNADDELQEEGGKPAERSENARPLQEEGAPPVKVGPRVDNIEELKEITLGAISNTIRMLGYGNAVISSLVFHSRFKNNAVENVGLMALTKDPHFIKRIKRELKSRGVQYRDDLKIEVVHESADTDSVTAVTEGIGVEVLTPKDNLKRLRARVTATEGITWEPEYILEPTGKQYFIGRCKDPKIENGPKIHNDIAFVGIEEKNEAAYKINNHISRSHAVIIFDKDLGAYKIFRSRFLNNPSHKIKIFNTTLHDFNGITLGNPAVPHVLKNGDSICFNDTIILDFQLLD